MTERLIKCVCLLVLVFSCIKEEEIPPDTSLQISLTASSELGLGEHLTVSIEVKKALGNKCARCWQVLDKVKNVGENPEDVLTKDIPLMISIAMWLFTAGSVLIIFRG